MLLAMDIGNTNTVLGIFDGDRLAHEWRVRTEINETADEYGVLIRNLFQVNEVARADIRDVIVSCVVPPMVNTVQVFCEKYFHCSPLWVGPEIDTGVPILYENPKEVGADRIVNAVAAFDRFKESTIVVDFGTATTFDFVSARGEYEGGVICPGITISCEALFQKASKLPRAEIFARPRTVLAKNTLASINAGIVYGYAGLVEGIIARVKREGGRDSRVVATGGLAPLIAAECPAIEEVDEHLTLKGLKIIFQRCREQR